MDAQSADNSDTIPAPAPECEEVGGTGTTVFFSRTEMWIHVVKLDEEVPGGAREFYTRNSIETFSEERLAHWRAFAHTNKARVRIMACVDVSI